MMFTGLVEEIGYLESVVHSGNSMKIRIKASRVLENVRKGDSISTNGVCLTVTSFDSSTYTADVMPETMRLTNLGSLVKGSPVNLERAMLAGDRFGGHIVSGHIDGIGRVRSFREEDNATWISVECTAELLKYIVAKGSIAMDGTSLTVVDTDNSGFRVSIIPTTKDETALLRKKAGDPINLECDILGKYVERLLSYRDDGRKKDISMDFLKDNGFL